MPANRFANAILSDLSHQYDPEEVVWWLSEGGTPYLEDNRQSSSHWTSVVEAVAACTRDLRSTGYYPETVLAAVKSGMREAAASLVPPQAVANLIRQTAQACISAYFEDPRSVKATSARPPVSIPNASNALQVWNGPGNIRDLLLIGAGNS